MQSISNVIGFWFWLVVPNYRYVSRWWCTGATMVAEATLPNILPERDGSRVGLMAYLTKDNNFGVLLKWQSILLVYGQRDGLAMDDFKATQWWCNDVEKAEFSSSRRRYSNTTGMNSMAGNVMGVTIEMWMRMTSLKDKATQAQRTAWWEIYCLLAMQRQWTDCVLEGYAMAIGCDGKAQQLRWMVQQWW